MARISLRRLGERADLSVPRGSPQMGARYDADAFGRFAEGMARFLGTGRFIVGQTVFVIGWIILNTIGMVKHWDPYPFILLNLAFSTQAAYAAPLILLAQNRQDDRDRANIERDREVAARTQADTEFLARELAAVRLALADVVTTQDLEDSLSRLAKVFSEQPLPNGHGPLKPSDSGLPRPAIARPRRPPQTRRQYPIGDDHFPSSGSSPRPSRRWTTSCPRSRRHPLTLSNNINPRGRVMGGRRLWSSPASRATTSPTSRRTQARPSAVLPRDQPAARRRVGCLEDIAEPGIGDRWGWPVREWYAAGPAPTVRFTNWPGPAEIPAARCRAVPRAR